MFFLQTILNFVPSRKIKKKYQYWKNAQKRLCLLFTFSFNVKFHATRSLKQTQPALTCSESTIKTPKECVNSVQS